MTNNKKTVLVVEDNEVDRRMLEQVLKKRGFHVVAVAEGSKCLPAVGAKRPDIVLMDILMPDIDGNQLLHLLRAQYNAVEMPILMTTVKGGTAEIIESLALGANDYLVKPIDFDVMLMRIQTHLTVSDQARSLNRLRALEAVAALITTYNHEINNPLAVAISSLKGLEALKGEKSYARLESSLWRISDVIKLLKDAISGTGLELEKYGEHGQIITLK